MDKITLYKKFNFTQDEILKGEELLSTYSAEMRKKFLHDIYADYKLEGGFISVYFLYGHYPHFKKVILCSIAIDGNEEEQVKLAWGLSHPQNNSSETIEDLYPLIYDWIQSTKNLKIIYWLSFGMLYFLDKQETKTYIDQNISKNEEFAKALLEWLQHQPKWYRIKFRKDEVSLWQQLQIYWPQIANDAFKAREINKALGLYIDLDEVWYHEIENPWRYSAKLINELSETGIQIKYIPGGEIAMGGPVVDQLVLNNREFSVAGPFITDTNREFLCCKLYSYDAGRRSFNLVLIDLKTSDVFDLEYEDYNAIPYKYEDDAFIILKGGYLRKVNFENDILKFYPPKKYFP